MAEKQFLTKKGYDERVARLEELKVVRRKEVAQKLKEESRAIYQRTLSTMQLRTSREISKQKLQNLKQFLLTVRLFRITIRIKM